MTTFLSTLSRIVKSLCFSAVRQAVKLIQETFSTCTHAFLNEPAEETPNMAVVQLPLCRLLRPKQVTCQHTFLRTSFPSPTVRFSLKPTSSTKECALPSTSASPFPVSVHPPRLKL